MLLGHLLHTHVCPHHYTSEIGGQPSQPVYGCFEVLLMSAEVDQSGNFVAMGDDVLPIFVLVLVEAFRDDLFALFVEAHNLLAD